MQKTILLVDSGTGSPVADLDGNSLPGYRLQRCAPSALDTHAGNCIAVLADAGLGVPALTDMVATCHGKPLLVLAGKDEPDLCETLLSAGAADFLVVPAAQDTALARSLSNALARERGRERVLRRATLLGRLFSIVSRKELSVAEQIDRLLETGCELFGLDDGTLAYVESGYYIVEHAYSRDGNVETGEQWFLSETFCESVLETLEVLAIENAEDQAGHQHPAVVRGQRSYLGVPVILADQVYGTLAFAGRIPHPQAFSGTDREFVATLADWLGSLLTRAQMLGDLNLLASYDALTSLPNRRAFLGKLERSIEHCRYTDRNPFALLFIDLDGFKAINDRAGHLAGDDLLAAVARRLESLLLPKDIVARYAGDEFAVLLEDVDPEQAEMVARRIRSAFEEHFCLPSCEARVGASIGVIMHQPGIAAEELIRRADQAMYEAKRSGAGVCRA